MSCRTTQGGTLMTRLGRSFSGLSDKKVTSLFHALKREGDLLDEPSREEIETWRAETREMLYSLELSDSLLERSERDLFLAKDETYDGPTFHALQNILRRARQEAVIISVKSAVADISHPGDEKEMYELDEDGNPKYVWYASYGSNLSADRFMKYIKGGSADGTSSVQSGARDKSDPLESTAIRFEGRMHFAGTSYRWGKGGIAFMDNDSSGHALGRAYLITFEQFEDVVAQENGKSSATVSIKGSEVLANGNSEVGAGLYNNLVHIGDYKGYPVFTFSSSFSAQDAVSNAQITTGYKRYGATNKPSKNYLRMIGKGLAESFEMEVYDQADYLLGTLGTREYSRDEMISILSTPADPVEEKIKPRYNYDSSSRYPSPRSARWELDDWGEDDFYGSDEYEIYKDARRGEWPPKRDYQPWFLDTPSSSDKYYDTYLDEPAYLDEEEDEEGAIPLYGEKWYRTSSPRIHEVPMAFRNLDGTIDEDYYADAPPYCGICDDFGHDVYSCPKG